MILLIKKFPLSVLRLGYLLLFAIPVNIIWSHQETTLRWAFFQYQTTHSGSSIIPLTSKISFIILGGISGITGLSEILFCAGIIFLVLSYVCLLSDIRNSIKKAGLGTIFGGCLLLGSTLLRNDIFFREGAGTGLPLGILAILVAGIFLCKLEAADEKRGDFVYRENSRVFSGFHSLFSGFQNRSGENFSIAPWKAIYYLNWAFILIISLMTIIPVIGVVGTGHDFKVYMSAAQSVLEGKDPYLLENIEHYSGVNLAFAYPPYTLLFFIPIFRLVQMFPDVGIYYMLLFFLLIAAAFFCCRIDRKPDLFFLGILLIAGFSSLYWIFFSGNFALIYLLFITIALYYIVREQFLLAAATIGFIASFALFPIFFSALFLGIRRSVQERLGFVVLSGYISGVILAITCIITPSMVISYFYLLIGKNSPVYDYGGICTPTPFFTIADLLKEAGFLSITMILGVLVLYCGLVAISAHFFYKRCNGYIQQIAFLIFPIFMLLPRTQPYYYIILAVPVYFLFKDTGFELKAKVMGICCGLPIILHADMFQELQQFVPVFITQHYMSVCLFLTYIFIIYLALKNQFPEPGKTGE